MRSNEERIAEVKRRIAEKEYKKRLRREWAAAICCVAACLAVIAGVSLSMPDIVSQIEMGTASNFETTATMLGGSSAPGYIVVGLLAFVLGVCVTVLCFRIRRLNEEEQTGEPKGETAIKAGQQEILLFPAFQIPDTTQAKAQQGNRGLQKVTDDFHLHFPPFAPLSVLLHSVCGCGKRIQKKNAERMGCRSLLRGRMSCSDRRCFPFHA